MTFKKAKKAKMWAQFDELKPVKNVIIIVFDRMTLSNHPDIFVHGHSNYRKTGGVIIFLRYLSSAQDNQLKQQ